MERGFVALTGLLSFFLVAVSLFGQGVLQGGISGQVTDPSGAVIPGATVTVTSPALLQPLVVTTSDDGTYQFPTVPVGTYSVKFDFTGYRSVLREGVEIEAGFRAQINVRLDIASVTQSVEVSASSPVVDTQSTSLTTHVDEQRIQDIPSGLGNYNMIEEMPSVTAATKDVGGNTNGQQTSFMFRGAVPTETRQLYDGGDLAPADYGGANWIDVYSIKEAQISEAGANVQQQASALQVNYIGKGGTDQLHGTVHYDWEDRRLEGNNVTPLLLAAVEQSGASAGAPLLHFQDWGGEIGGPIKKGKLWFWADWSRQDTTGGADKSFITSGICPSVQATPLNYRYGTIRGCTTPNPLTLMHAAYKISWSPFHNNTFNFTNRYDTKDQFLFKYTYLTAVASSSPITFPCSNPVGNIPKVWDSCWPSMWIFNDTQIINNRWVVSGDFIHVSHANTESLHSPSLINVPAETEQSTKQVAQSLEYQYAFEGINSADVQSTYFLPGKLGGDHSFQFGYKYSSYENDEVQNWGASAEEVFSSGTAPAFSVPLEVDLFQPGHTDAFLYENSAYFMDSYSHRRLHLNLGIRWDQQWDTNKAESIPASQYEGMATAPLTPGGPPGPAFNLLPAISFAGSHSPVTWNTFAPRLGVAYDLRGNGKTVLKASFSQYFDMRFSGELSTVTNPTGIAVAGQGVTQNEVILPWAGPNTGGPIDMSKVSLSPILGYGGQFNVTNPGSPLTANSVSPSIKAPKTTEFTVGVSHELAANFGLDVTYIWRNYTDFIWNQLNGISSANYSPCTWSPGTTSACNPSLKASTCPAGADCSTVTYYVPNITVPTAYTETNQPGYYQRYQGIEIEARKRFSRNWFMNASYVYQSDIQVWPNANSYQDPTNIAIENHQQYAPSTGGYTLPTGVNARWIFRVDGRYVLPHGIGLAVNDDYRQGYALLQAINISTRPDSAGSAAALENAPGNTREPNLFALDVSIDKTFSLNERIKIRPAFDLFNLLNYNAVLAQSTTQNSSSANFIGQVQPPRLARLSVLLTF